MASIVDPLDSPRFKLEHAKYHAKAVAVEFDAFLKTKPYTLIEEVNPDTREKLLKLKLIKEMPRIINGLTNDAFGNLRSVLDQIGYAVAKATVPPGKGRDCSFPIGDDETAAKSRIGGVSKELPREIFDVMLSFKPYRGGDDLLWALNQICNTDKHRIVRPVFFTSSKISWENMSTRGTVGIGGSWDSSKNELLLASIEAGGFLSADNFKISSFVAFDDIEIIGGEPVLKIFNALAGKVESILMAVEAEARRIGLFT